MKVRSVIVCLLVVLLGIFGPSARGIQSPLDDPKTYTYDFDGDGVDVPSIRPGCLGHGRLGEDGVCRCIEGYRFTEGVGCLFCDKERDWEPDCREKDDKLICSGCRQRAIALSVAY